MLALISSPADCDVRPLMNFLNAQNIVLIKIHHQLCLLYRLDVMCKQLVYCWCCRFSNGRQNVHDDKQSGRPSLINDELMKWVWQCILGYHTVPLSNFIGIFCRYPDASCTKLPQSTCCPKNCVPGECWRTSQLNTKTNTWEQHLLFCNSTTVTAISSSARLSQAIRLRLLSVLLIEFLSCPGVLQWTLAFTAKHCRTCDRLFRTRSMECSLQVLF